MKATLKAESTSYLKNFLRCDTNIYAFLPKLVAGQPSTTRAATELSPCRVCSHMQRSAGLNKEIEDR